MRGSRGGDTQPYLHFLTTPRHFGDVAHDVFRCHRFPGPAFSAVRMSKQRRHETTPPEPPVLRVLRGGMPGQGQGLMVGDSGCGLPPAMYSGSVAALTPGTGLPRRSGM